MADFSKAITNSVRAFGGGPCTRWGQLSSFTTMTWGTSTWGEGESLPLRIIKVISNNQSSDTAIFKRPTKVISESVAASSEMISEGLTQGVWDYVFHSNTTEAENRDFATWTSSTGATTSFTSGVEPSTSWTEG